MNKDVITKAYNNIKKPVKILPLGIKGKVSGIFLNNDTLDYQVYYYYNGEQKRVYFEPDELEFIEEKSNLGFNK